MEADIKYVKIFGAAQGLRAEGRACGIAENNIKNSKARGASPTQPLNNILIINIRAGQVVSRSLANAVYLPKHDGNGDNRFAIIIQGSGGDDSFEQDQYTYNVREMARLLTEHPRNYKPGPGYTGYYLQDHMYFAQSHDKDNVYRNIPEIDKDVEIPNKGRHDGTGKTRIFNMISEVARTVDSYDNVLFYYTAHGRPYKWSPYSARKFLFDANNQHETKDKVAGESDNDAKWSTTGDIWIKELDAALDPVICHKMILILQPCFSGNWIDYNEKPPDEGDDAYKITLVNDDNEKNRVVFTSEVKSGYDDKTPHDDDDVSKLSLFGKCNMAKEWLFSGGSPKVDGQKVYFVGYDKVNKKNYPDNNVPRIDGEEYTPQAGESEFKYRAKYYNEKLIQIDTVEAGSFTLKFYENWEDRGAEFVSGLTEAFIIDRFSDSTVQSNDILDADESINNGYNGYTHYSTNDGNSDKYISCEEAFKYMRLWQLGVRLDKNPWIDTPQITYSHLEEGNNYLF